MLNRFKRPAAVVMLAATAGCSSLQPVLVEPAGFIQEKAPAFVVVTTAETEANGDRMVLAGPRVEGNNLMGRFDGEDVAVPIMQVRTVQAIQPDRRRTAFAILGLAVVTGAVTYLMVGNGSRIDNTVVCVPEGHRGDQPYCDI